MKHSHKNVLKNNIKMPYLNVASFIIQFKCIKLCIFPDIWPFLWNHEIKYSQKMLKWLNCELKYLQKF